MTETDIIDGLLQREGGWTDHPADHGGPTNFGITLDTYRAWAHDPTLTIVDLQHLTAVTAAAIYRSEYIDKPGFTANNIPFEPLRVQLIDYCVMSGPVWATKVLQELLGVSRDGVLGPQTLGALAMLTPRALVALNLAYTKRRAHNYARIVQADPSQAAFIVGWIDRTLSFLD